MKTTLFIFAFLQVAFTTSLSSQEIENLPNSPYGSAGDCKGKSLVVNCFISEIKHPWAEEEKEGIITKGESGFVWLKKKAQNWKQLPISFQQISIGLGQNVVVSEIVNAHTIKQIGRLKVHWATYALHAAGYPNIYHFYDSLKKLYEVDNIVVLVFANKEGRSYAQPTYTNGVIFNKEWFV